MGRFLLIVAPEKVHLVDKIKQGLGAAAQNVELIIDRRAGPGAVPRPAASPAAERRRARIDQRLRTVGWALVPVA